MCGVVWPDRGKLTLSRREQTVVDASPGKSRKEGKRKFCGREVLPKNSVRNQHLLPQPGLSTKKETTVLSLLSLSYVAPRSGVAR